MLLWSSQKPSGIGLARSSLCFLLYASQTPAMLADAMYNSPLKSLPQQPFTPQAWARRPSPRSAHSEDESKAAGDDQPECGRAHGTACSVGVVDRGGAASGSSGADTGRGGGGSCEGGGAVASAGESLDLPDRQKRWEGCKRRLTRRLEPESGRRRSG